MATTLSLEEQRQIENEMNFRRVNEVIAADLDRLDEELILEGNSHLVRDDIHPLYFLCECADENCVERIALTLSLYQKLHNQRSTFITKHDHVVARIERTIVSRADYTVVRKKEITPPPRPRLNKTSSNLVRPTPNVL